MSESSASSPNMDDLGMSPSPPPDAHDGAKSDSKKRPSPSGESGQPQKITKRRAARACVSCRARKVRCDVVEGAPCGNCRWDNVECIVQESRRRKKNPPTANGVGPTSQAEAQIRCKTTSAATSSSINANSGAPMPNRTSSVSSSIIDPRRTSSGSVLSSATTMVDADGRRASVLPNVNCVTDSHVPHMIYQRTSTRPEPPAAPTLKTATKATNITATNTATWLDATSTVNPTRLFGGDARTLQFLNGLDDAHDDTSAALPGFLRPLPTKIASEDVSYLYAKGSLTLPSFTLQNALIQAYIEYVHPYMPLMDLHPFLTIVNNRDGFSGQVSLLLYHAVMFSATAFVDMKHLREAGYTTRKAARKAFFQKTRLLYDFDYESDRLVLVQSLMLMTYWYETPDDQKDTWHWMGVAISLAHTIGLHRNPGATGMAPAKQKLWKRIWWSCFMRDRLIALGMRRPTRIKDEDFDVPMLVESDFEILPLSDSNSVVPPECIVMRDVAMQRELAVMCIAKAKLCVCISHMLKTQYSVLIRDNMKPENTTNSTMMLFPNKTMENAGAVGTIDGELREWSETLPALCHYSPITQAEINAGRSTLAVQRTLLHMVYQTTVSALHRPQFLPSSPMQAPVASRQVQDVSRTKVRNAAMQITRMASDLHNHRLERYLPTTGVTVILPAMIIHLLEMKNPESDARERATFGFRQCMRVMEKLREIYSAADYATGFLDAALRKAAIDVQTANTPAAIKNSPLTFVQTPPPEMNISGISGTDAMLTDKTQGLMSFSKATPRQTISAPALSLATATTTTSPQADELTPSASGASESTPMEAEPMDMDFMQGHDEFDWNAVAGTDFDVDQFLQFPAEGVTNVEDDLMAGLDPAMLAVDEPALTVTV